MDTYHVDELLYPIGNGATIPILGVVNNKNYIIKTFNNIEGNKTLINELVCHYIAKKLNFPIPDAKFKSVLNLDLNVMKETVDYFKENLTKDFLESIVDKIPEVFEHNKNELKALIQYLLYRMEHIDYYADLILNTNY